ncbi:MAG: hypothetical protein Q8S26_02730 [Azonexus sp.]|nr:hypothetical protein [Azonexus sp.]
MKNFLCHFAAALAFCSLSACSTAATHADIRIINRSTGEQLPTYRHKGELWVAGKPGDRYSILVNNRTGGRLLTVVSVDGVNVLSGDTAATNQRGYVLSPRDAVDIAGWRKSERDVAAFYFTSLDDSYAARTKRPDNVGVIGVAAFREYQVPVQVQEMSANAASAPMRSREAAAPAAAADKAESKLGTGHGERVYSPTQTVEFQRASNTPDDVITVRYDSYANLVARGVIPSPRRHPSPNAFPGGNYVPDPS